MGDVYASELKIFPFSPRKQLIRYMRRLVMFGDVDEHYFIGKGKI